MLSQKQIALIPVLSGFAYESGGAFSSATPIKYYFTEHEVPFSFSTIRRITMTSDAPAAETPGHDEARTKPVGGTTSPRAQPSEKGLSESDRIRREIADIEASGQYSKMPTPQVVAPSDPIMSGGVRYMIENGTKYSLTLLLAGPVTQQFIILAGATQALAVPAGTYKVARA
jgi:hypothetical protein